MGRRTGLGRSLASGASRSAGLGGSRGASPGRAVARRRLAEEGAPAISRGGGRDGGMRDGLRRWGVMKPCANIPNSDKR